MVHKCSYNSFDSKIFKMSFEYKALSFTSSFKMFLLWGSSLIRYYKLQGCGLHMCVCVCVYMYVYEIDEAAALILSLIRLKRKKKKIENVKK